VEAGVVAKQEWQLAGPALDKGLDLCRRSEESQGILWLARSLELAPREAHDLQRVARTNLAGCRSRISALRAILEHRSEVAVVSFSPDGQATLTGSGNETQQWEVATGKPMGPPVLHQGQVWASSPDGKIILTRSPATAPAKSAATVQLWEAASGKAVGAPLSHPGVESAAFSPDSSTV